MFDYIYAYPVDGKIVIKPLGSDYSITDINKYQVMQPHGELKDFIATCYSFEAFYNDGKAILFRRVSGSEFVYRQESFNPILDSGHLDMWSIQVCLRELLKYIHQVTITVEKPSNGRWIKAYDTILVETYICNDDIHVDIHDRVKRNIIMQSNYNPYSQKLVLSYVDYDYNIIDALYTTLRVSQTNMFTTKYLEQEEASVLVKTWFDLIEEVSDSSGYEASHIVLEDIKSKGIKTTEDIKNILENYERCYKTKDLKVIASHIKSPKSNNDVDNLAMKAIAAMNS